MEFKTSAIKLLVYVTLLLISALAPVTFVSAERQLNIRHTPPRLDALPGPLLPFTVKVHLENTVDTGVNVEGFFVRDGSLLRLTSTRSYIDDNGLPAYEFSVDAPLAQLSYHFTLTTDWGHTNSSPRYVLTRDCKPGIKTQDLIREDFESGTDKISYLLASSRKLERDLAHYQRALELLNDVKSLLDNQ